jgi:acyl carrier protein
MTMSVIRSQGNIARVEINTAVVAILNHITSDWDQDFAGGIQTETLLIRDLGFESIDVVQFVAALEDRFGSRNLPFEKLLMIDGRYVDDLSVGDVVDFLDLHLNAGRFSCSKPS